ncbi:MAG TPA: gliding motility-associated ABC transporter substrate-binding protein GldG, partial [Mucilaginibacter sp.]|nr:gliding motility-associated ABC transporter substrate-binding protein GldG [Mucilaginibacter sp.]
PTAGIKGLSDEEQKKVYDSLESKGVVGQGFSRKTDNGISQILIFPQALVQYQGQSIAVNLLQSQVGLSDDEISKNSIQNLEYAFSSAIKKITSGGKPEIGFTEGHNELKDIQLYGAMKSLSDGFSVGRVNLKTIPFQALQGLKLLVIPKPDKPFTELEKFKLDQYIMRGGRVVWTIDQVSAELDSLQGHGGEQLTFNKQLNLDDQLFVYGVRINYDLIADMRCGQIAVVTGQVGGQPQMQTVPWLFYPILTPLSKNPVVKSLDIRTEFISTIDTIAVKDIKKTILLTSSQYNKKFNAPYMLSLQALEKEPDPKDFQNVPKTVGVLLEGKFKSDFLNRPLPDSLKEKIESLPQSVPTKMIVISDGDVFKNEVSADGTPYPLGYDHYTQQTFGNKNLLLNIADYMTDDSGLIELRTKEIQIRPLDRPKIRSEKLYWQVLNNVVPLAFVLIFAIFQHYIRRRKYAH